jgi:TPR repeat protein
MQKRILYFKGALLITSYLLSSLNAEETNVALTTAANPVVCPKFVCPVKCPPCDEPLPGTALWHYMKGIEEIMGMRNATNAYLANEHFKRAADMDYAPAIKALADSYYSGDGIDKDVHQALMLYIRASDLGDGSAQFNAGVILLRGYAGSANTELAFYYLCLATMNEGLDEMAQDAAIYRDEAGALITPIQAQNVFRKLINNPALKPNKRGGKGTATKPVSKPALLADSTLTDQLPVTTSRLASDNQEAH